MNSNVCVLAMDWTSYDGKGWLNLLDLDKVSGVVKCGMVWCGVVWCDLVCCGLI